MSSKKSSIVEDLGGSFDTGRARCKTFTVGPSKTSQAVLDLQAKLAFNPAMLGRYGDGMEMEMA